MRGGMRRICSLVWNDIRNIQTIGNMKNSRMSVSAMPRKMRPARLPCSMVALSRPSGVAVCACAQPQPVFDENVRQDVRDQPEDHQQSRRPAYIGVLEKLQI